jgi:hypothetical protein
VLGSRSITGENIAAGAGQRDRFRADTIFFFVDTSRHDIGDRPAPLLIVVNPLRRFPPGFVPSIRFPAPSNTQRLKNPLR